MAFLVEPRVVRRVIRELHGYARLSTRVPHTDVLVVRHIDVRQYAHPDELGLDDFSQLPDLAILVAQPEEHELENQPLQDLMQLEWARLFHGCIDLTLTEQIDSGLLTRARIQECIDQVGQVEFDEAHAVLRSELRLIDSESYVEAYCEFVAVFLTLSRFSPDLLAVWFPSLTNVERVLAVLSQRMDVDRLFRETQLYGATQPDLTSGNMMDEARVASERQSWTEGISLQPSVGRYNRLVRKRARWGDRGNTVAAAVCAMRAVEAASTEDEKQTAQQNAEADIAALALRLRAALNFRETDLEDWRQSMWELLQNSTHGFWNSDKKLLYDLQKVCLDHERTVYKVDLVKWIVSRGKRPLRRPLTNLREVMMAKHLASSAARLVYVRLSGAERLRLSRLLHAAAELAEEQMRQRMRSALQETIVEVGLTPKSVPEQVAFDKVVEESLDCITLRGYLTMGYLRDAISRNDLKLPDLTDPRDLIRGDHLLRTDDRLDVSLDGVYRRGEFYLRWLQIVSSLAFGTRVGRFATLFLAIPFGGAVVIVVGVHHLLGLGHSTPDEHEAAVDESTLPDSDSPIETEDSPTDVATSETPLADTPDAPTESVAAAVTDDASPVTDDATDIGQTSTEKPVVTALLTSIDGEATESTSEAVDEETVGQESVGQPDEPPNFLYEWVGEQTVPLSIAIGFLLMALIHLPKFRQTCGNVVRYVWKIIRTVIWDTPMKLARLPIIRKVWRSRWLTRLRRYITTPFLIAWLGCRVLPTVLDLVPQINLSPQSWQMVGIVGLLLSFAINSRLGRDAEELAGEWLANVWHDLRSRFLVALFEWVMDFFKWVLNVVERFIYAVDEWLRFHSGETWASLVAKACLGVVWSFVAFLIRIYVNLLIEPTLHPVKHFPVVTVAHKIFLPFILVIRDAMLWVLTPYVGVALAETITWFNILFLPGIFGFLVWELKENWRLYASNRVPYLQPIAIGSHGETGARLLKPGFHSGTLPKLFGRLRRLERKPPSFHRFSERRAFRESLEHVERDFRRFVERDLIQFLSYCVVWKDSQVTCRRVHSASNSLMVELDLADSPHPPLQLLFQEQSGWLVATVAEHGWLDFVTPEQLHSFETALRGFYKKASVDLVREQLERRLIGHHPYDVCDQGLAIWPDRQFDREIICNLHRRHQIRPSPPSLAASYGLQPASRESVVFAESELPWVEWKQLWATPENSESAHQLPLACMQSARTALIRTART